MGLVARERRAISGVLVDFQSNHLQKKELTNNSHLLLYIARLGIFFSQVWSLKITQIFLLPGSILPPYVREEKNNNLDAAGIEPRPAA